MTVPDCTPFAVVASGTPFARVRIIHTEYEPHTRSWCGEIRGVPGCTVYCSTEIGAIAQCTRFAEGGSLISRPFTFDDPYEVA